MGQKSERESLGQGAEPSSAKAVLSCDLSPKPAGQEIWAPPPHLSPAGLGPRQDSLGQLPGAGLAHTQGRCSGWGSIGRRWVLVPAGQDLFLPPQCSTLF